MILFAGMMATESDTEQGETSISNRLFCHYPES
ncbi:hypothetical protein PANT111_100204 [Pantoea brenneri]|uniref:Uncharacterized protein n=1 Tax=Pantoea brenneri TaxID=472694 RepID=A0AAX3J197_9GAMM|nr:hypothetical protein PANT111_100204 [Pantoea brenneri]